MVFRVEGVIVALVTPLQDRDDVDTQAIGHLVDFLIGRGVHGLFPCGTTGEGPLLSTAERRQVAEAVVKAANGRVPVIVHTGAATTAEALALTRHAQEIGAQAAAVVPPYYYRYGDEALLRHFQAIAQAVPGFPIYLYNIPHLAGNALRVDLIRRLVETCPNIVGLKDSSGSLQTLTACAPLRDHSFNTAVGSDGLILAGLAVGCHACVSGNANVVPELIVSLYDAVHQGNLELARQLQRQVDAVRQLLGDGSDLSLYKGILTRRGLSTGNVRAPLVKAPEAVIDECWQMLQSQLKEVMNRTESIP